LTFLKVILPKHCHVLLLEDSELRIEWFRKRIPNLKVVKTVQELRDYFDTHPTVDFLLLDHDLGEKENGVDAAKFIVERFGGISNWGLIHSWNRSGAQAMQAAGFRVQHIPFGEFELEVEN